MRKHWDRAYVEGWIPWDIGAPQPAFVRLADAGLLSGPALDSGCGTGEHALLLASRGIEVVGIDISRVAIERARAKALERRLSATFVVGDARELAHLGRSFACVVDSGMFHSLDDRDRALYVASLAAVVQAGGTVNLLCFSELTPGTEGPRRVRRTEIREAFADGWRVASIEAERFAVTPDFSAERPHAWLARIVRASATMKPA